ncbi:MAG: hypothetical protein IPJ10_04535 [Flavobacteriales bacterium]|nr:hypothetical protein [Flavobacteriales bacterium]
MCAPSNAPAASASTHRPCGGTWSTFRCTHGLYHGTRSPKPQAERPMQQHLEAGATAQATFAALPLCGLRNTPLTNELPAHAHRTESVSTFE